MTSGDLGCNYWTKISRWLYSVPYSVVVGFFFFVLFILAPNFRISTLMTPFDLMWTFGNCFSQTFSQITLSIKVHHFENSGMKFLGTKILCNITTRFLYYWFVIKKFDDFTDFFSADFLIRLMIPDWAIDIFLIICRCSNWMNWIFETTSFYVPYKSIGPTRLICYIVYYLV